MARKTLGKSRKIKPLTNYLGDVGVYDLSRPLKSGGEKYSFLVIAKNKGVSGPEMVTVWLANDETGNIADNKPIRTEKQAEIADVLVALGYNLVN